jgi:hypothetical protein
MDQALKRLPLDATYVLARSGGKAVFTNRPVEPGEPTVKETGIEARN